MKLYEVTQAIHLNFGNVKCVLTVKTDSISTLFGGEYNGDFIKYGGVNGRVGDIPAYLGGYNVLSVELRDDTYYIEI